MAADSAPDGYAAELHQWVLVRQVIWSSRPIEAIDISRHSVRLGDYLDTGDMANNWRVLQTRPVEIAQGGPVVRSQGHRLCLADGSEVCG